MACGVESNSLDFADRPKSSPLKSPDTSPVQSSPLKSPAQSSPLKSPDVRLLRLFKSPSVAVAAMPPDPIATSPTGVAPAKPADPIAANPTGVAPGKPAACGVPPRPPKSSNNSPAAFPHRSDALAPNKSHKLSSCGSGATSDVSRNGANANVAGSPDNSSMSP